MYLPTLTSTGWSVTGLLASLREGLRRDVEGEQFIIYAYAVTSPGWRELRVSCTRWLRAKAGRSIVAYIGTDHGLTEPDSVRTMVQDGIEVRLMCRYRGVFHAKVFWLRARKRNQLWVGSNNLTREGLLNNIEFALTLSAKREDRGLIRWHDAVHAGSEAFSESLLESYEAERRVFARRRADSPGTFTWTRREEPPETPRGPRPRASTRGTLIVEVMPRETGTDGSQIQLPKEAATQFFGLANRSGASRRIDLTPLGSNEARSLTMTLFGNNTIRLSVSELDYRDRPCVLVIRRINGSAYTLEIVKENIFPTRFRRLLAQCNRQTRVDSRRWTVS